jgi:hypothetical protein
MRPAASALQACLRARSKATGTVTHGTVTVTVTVTVTGGPIRVGRLSTRTPATLQGFCSLGPGVRDSVPVLFKAAAWQAHATGIQEYIAPGRAEVTVAAGRARPQNVTRAVRGAVRIPGANSE